MTPEELRETEEYRSKVRKLWKEVYGLDIDTRRLNDEEYMRGMFKLVEEIFESSSEEKYDEMWSKVVQYNEELVETVLKERNNGTDK